jgi:3-hydroxybutyryl-CoA dehydratase
LQHSAHRNEALERAKETQTGTKRGKRSMQISNVTFDEIAIGDTATYTRLITNQEVEAFAAISGDHNPLHLDPDYAATTPFGECIAHGMLTGALISAAIAMQLPGPGSVYLNQSLQFRAPVLLGDTLTVMLEVIEKHGKRPWVTLSCTVENQDGKAVAKGEAQVAAPTEKETVTVVPPPAIQLLEEASLASD